MKASDASIAKALGEILERERVVQSQARLQALLSERHGIETGGLRLRRLARKTGIRLTMEWKHGKDMSTCPLCGKELKDVFAQDLFGKETFIARRCPCGFKAYRNKVPKRYVFQKGKKNAV